MSAEAGHSVAPGSHEATRAASVAVDDVQLVDMKSPLVPTGGRHRQSVWLACCARMKPEATRELESEAPAEKAPATRIESDGAVGVAPCCRRPRRS